MRGRRTTSRRAAPRAAPRLCGRRPTRRAAGRRGQVLIIVLLGIGLLVGLLFYVYNAGEQINRRVQMQNAADSTAVSGAAWLARSFNLIAMNNVAASRMLALVPVMDAVPQAGDMAFSELNDWIGDDAYSGTVHAPGDGLTGIADQLGGSVPGLDGSTRSKVRDGIESLLKRMRNQREMIAPFRSPSEGGSLDMADVTTWSVRGTSGSEPHGQLWRAATVLDELNQATVDSAGVLAQANAVRFGRDNGADVAMLVPIVPEIPAERGELRDFEPVLRKRLRVDLKGQSARQINGNGGSIPHWSWPERLGPWARLFDPPAWYRRHRWGERGWRHTWGVRVPTGSRKTRQVPPREGRRIRGPSAGGGRAGRGASRGHGPRRGGTRSWQPTKKIPRGYTTYGPYYWAHKWVTDLARHQLSDSRFREYYDKMADTKLGYMFSGSSPELKTMHRPWWVTDLEAARQYGDNPAIRKSFTKYYYLEIIYKGSGDSRRVTSDNLRNPVARDFRGWVPPEQLRSKVFSGNPDVSAMEQVGDLPMWKFTAEGIEQRLSPGGEVVDEWEVHFEWYFIFGGLDCGGDVVITNPCNWDAGDTLPAPMLMAEAARSGYSSDPDAGARREFFSVLGVVRQPARAGFWARRFSSQNPLESIVTVAQAKVFNNQSWDLWTQDWQAQLTPVRHWGDWVGRLDWGLDRVGETGGMVSADEVRRIRDYMWHLGEETAEFHLTH
ncbi:MAG: pilus assembly protein TadG-related protein [Planctomycetota bacterium]